MKPHSSLTLDEIQHLYDTELPLFEDRQLVFSQLLGSIAWCERLGSSAWSLTQLADGFRLNVGQVEAMTCSFRFWSADEGDVERDTMFVTLRLLLAGPGCQDKLASLGEAADSTEMSYASVGEPHWCYFGSFEAGADGGPNPSLITVAEQLNLLQDNHRAFLELASRTPTGKLRQKSNFSRAHSPALYDYAMSVVRRAEVQGSQTPAGKAGGSRASRSGGSISPLERVRIEKAGADAGFELAPTWSGNTVSLRSVQFPEWVAVERLEGEAFLVSSSSPDVMPSGAQAAGVRVEGWQELYDVLGKIAATARTLPDRVAQQFAKKTAAMPKSTVAERWTVQRVGQGIFRKALLDLWRGQCCITGLALPELLRASHIKPWAACESDDERLDAFNGLLLSPNLDVLFDGGWISVADDGGILVSPALSESVQIAIGFSADWKVTGLLPKHAPYLSYHRKHVWRSEGVAHRKGDINA